MSTCRRIAGVVLCIAALGSIVNMASAQCVQDPPARTGYSVFYHNGGITCCAGCVQDFDLDFPEYRWFVSSFPVAGNTYPPVIADVFAGASCDPEHNEYPHGIVVESYFQDAYSKASPIRVESGNYGSWSQMINAIAGQYTRTVVSLSTGVSPTSWKQAEVDAVVNAYNHQLVVVGAAAVFCDDHDTLGDKAMMCYMLDASGEFVTGSPYAALPANCVAMNVPTNWFDATQNWYVISDDGQSGCTYGSARTESGSFSTPLLAGTVQEITDLVVSRNVSNADFVHTVMDYVISGCDRNIGTYEHLLTEDLPSFGPWSSYWGYGVYSPWKALLYAYGYGRVEAKDVEMGGPGNPPVVFSDHFKLRGDLLVPAGQIFRVSPLATVSVYPGSPEGPTELGLYPDLKEIRVAGTMEVESSLELDNMSDYWGVVASVIVDDGGACSVENSGTMMVDDGQLLEVRAGGELTVENGGKIEVMGGGMLVVIGDLNVEAGGLLVIDPDADFLVLGSVNNAGTLSLSPGSQTVFAADAVGTFSTDLIITAGASFVVNQGSSVTMAPGKKIDCSGTLQTNGTAVAPVLIRGATSGAGSWVGIVINTTVGSNNTLGFTQISDATVGVNVSGSAQPVLNVSYLNVHDCVTGVRITGRSNFTLYHGEFMDCTTAVELNQSSINITGASIHDNYVGVKCTTSSPTIRFCEIYKNHIGIHTANASSIPNVGTTADPGNNDFFGPSMKYPGQANDVHISAFDPSSNIYAQKNWWGTTNTSLIQQRILVIDSPPAGCGSVVFVPVLSGPPAGAVSQPPIDVTKETRDVPNLVEGTAPGMTTYLGQNRPNPFNPTTTIEFGLSERSRVNLEIYDAVGRLVRVLVDEERGEGVYNETWDGMDASGVKVASGVYFYRLTTNSLVETKKMILLK